MRKRYKLKKRSCRLCKPHKMKIEKRWDNKDEARLIEAEREMRSVLKTKYN